MYCPHCKTWRDGYDRYCQYCGSELSPYPPDVMSADSGIPGDDRGQPYIIDSRQFDSSPQFLPARRPTQYSAPVQPLALPLSDTQYYSATTHNYQYRQAAELTFELILAGVILGVLLLILGMLIATFMLRFMMVVVY